MSIQLCYKNSDRILTIPKKVLPESGTPLPHHFQGSAQENLVELACRICYESTKSSKTRASADMHKHIVEVNHGSTHAHVNFTVEISTINKQVNDFILWSCLNRPGVWVCENPDTHNIRITANLRAIREWDHFNSNVIDHKVQSSVGNLLKNLSKNQCPLIFFNIPVLHTDFVGQIVDPIFPEERWYSFYITDISRGCSHEWIRHSYHAAISQRSTRYCDESKSEWNLHPLNIKFWDEIHDEQFIIAHKLVSINQFVSDSRHLYEQITEFIQNKLVFGGADSLVAKKQARACGRDFLGTALSTELIYSCSLDECYEIVKQRANKDADASIRLVANEMAHLLENDFQQYLGLRLMKEPCPDDIGYHMDLIKS